MKTCTLCGVEQAPDAFYRDRRTRDGRQSSCKTCVRVHRQSIAQTESPEAKLCTRCDVEKPAGDFQKNKAARDGLQSYCKPCAADAQREYFERNAEVVALRRARKLLEPIGVDKTKVCKKCGNEKPLLEFYAHRGTKDRRATYCKACAREYDRGRRARDSEKNREYLRQWRDANVERRKELARAWNLRLYGLRPEDYIDLYEQQHGRCKICGTSGEDFGGRRLHVDHDHDTGKVRGLLCGLCNTGIGHLGDSPERLRIAASYIEEARTR